jgi:putative ATP-dependent endonuclease of OLD family
MKDILCLANGEDEQFNGLLREYFGIKKITAQIIVTTHSPNILSDDYKKIIRMYKADGLTKALSVKGLELTKAEQKQLLMQFEFIKEAVFARAAIVVEGVSEIGSFPAFASKLDIDFDKEGIALINAGGADSVLPIIKLLNKLGINSVGVIDNDKKVEENLPDEEYLFYTKTKCFDREVVERVSQNKNYDVLEKILMSYDSQGLDRCIHQKKLNSTKVKYGFKGVEITDSYKFKDVEKTSKLSKVMYVTWFEINKGILLGKTIGAEIEKKDIPICYIKAIRKAEKYAKGK